MNGKIVKLSLVSILCTLLVALNVAAQTESKTPIYAGIQGAPNFSYRVLSNNTNDPSVDDQIRILNDRETASLGYRFAIVAGADVFKNWTIETGISYLRNCTELTQKLEPFTPDSGTFIFDSSPDEVRIKECLNYLGIPIRIIYNLGTEKLRVRAIFGFTPQILLDQDTRAGFFKDGEEVSDDDVEDLEDAVGFNLSPLIGIGAQYALNDHFTLTAEGNARFGVVNVNEDSPINSYTYSSELNIGINYYFQPRK